MKLDELKDKICDAFPEMSFGFELDNYGQVIIYTNMTVDNDDNLIQMDL